ncbi:MAG: glycosyltransferase involved in cell wall biosynthesis [Arcobacteraceae bacterium]
MSQNKYLITVVTVCLNSEKTIRRTIESLVKQTNDDFQYVVIDGGSKDSTLQIVNEYSSQFRHPVKVISESDRGLYDAMNKGIRNSDGKYIALLNSDDWYELNAIDEVSKKITKNSVESKASDIYYGYIRIMKNDVEYMIRRNNFDFINDGHGLIQHPTLFISKDCYERFSYYDINYKVCADHDFLLKAINGGSTYKAIDSVITNFSTGGISDQIDAFQERMKVLTKHKIISKANLMKKYTVWYLSKLVKVFT